MGEQLELFSEKPQGDDSVLNSHDGVRGLDHIVHRDFLSAHADKLAVENEGMRTYVLINRLGGIRFVVEKPESQE